MEVIFEHLQQMDLLVGQDFYMHYWKNQVYYIPPIVIFVQPVDFVDYFLVSLK
jgi:hypothetical protein